MDNRLKLQSLLEEALGSKQVYFQPPSSIRMKYPAIVYSRNNIENVSANDSVYVQHYSYQITVMDYNPDSEIVKKISMIPGIRFGNHFTSEDLNHDVFTITF
jgi:hypothetical protein